MQETQKTESAGGIVMNEKGEVALVKNGPSFWGFPKGHIDAGEAALAAAKREIAEETGLHDIELIIKISVPMVVTKAYPRVATT